MLTITNPVQPVQFSPTLLRANRATAGFNRTRLAATLGVAEGTIGRWERGDSEPTATQLLTLARILQCRPEAFTRHTS